MRIWHHSFAVLENLPAYAEGLAAHFARVAAPGTEVVMHGMHRDTYRTEYPGNDIQFAYFRTLHRRAGGPPADLPASSKPRPRKPGS